jgi:VWFA-related protein
MPAADESDETRTDEPKAIGLVERAGTRLAQLDITVVGPPEVLATLTADDFTIKIHFTKVKEFRLDRLCDLPPTAEAAAPESEPLPDPGTAPQALSRATYLLYFDQTHMTLSGRQRSLELARELVERLIRDGSRGMIVSNAARLEVIEPFTDDAQRLRDALQRLETDRDQWDFFAQTEDARIEEVVRALNDEYDIQRAIGLARDYQKEEAWRADRGLRRLKLTLGQLHDPDPPKAVIYFADTMRSNPGEHYLSFFGDALRTNNSTLGIMASNSLLGGLPFDGVINEASAQGIRIYTVQAQGLVSQFDSRSVASAAMARTRYAPVSPSRVRVADAQETLSSMSGETGGHAFLNGVGASKIAERIVDDSSCVFLVSFDPTGFAQDSPLRAIVKTRREDIELRARGRIVIQSESARRTSELLRAFGSAGALSDPFELRAALVPTGFEDGQYSALLQLSVPGTPLQGSTWDLGATLVAREKIRDETSGRLSISGPGVPLIYESEIRFKPGAYELISVAHEGSSGLIASDELRFDWPAIDGSPATVGPIALLQPGEGAFLRDGETRSSGSVARVPSDGVLTDRPVALVGLVCRGRRQKGELEIRRSLVGASVTEFPQLEFDLELDRCAQLRDVVPEMTLAPGFYRYEVRVFQDERKLAEGQREFVAVGAGS